MNSKKLRIAIGSDLHVEFGDIHLKNDGNADLLILAGDICMLKDLDKQSERGDTARNFFMRVSGEFPRTLYLMGNHEHYHSKFHKTFSELLVNLPDNVELLEQDNIEIDGVIFVGATLWTDCNKNDPMTFQVLKHGMNDYRAITFNDRARSLYRKLDPRDTAEVHFKTVQYIRAIAELNRNKPLVVCTHHAPTYQSVADEYKSQREMNGGYASDLSEFILDNENIKFWTHGHMHDPSDYMVGQCRVLCNPRGYKGYEQRVNEFDPTVGFDITA